MDMVPAVKAVVALMILLGSTSAQDQGASRVDGSLIGIEHEPGRVVPIGGIARFEGFVFTDASLADRRIEIKVSSPDGRSQVFTMAYAQDGAFQYHIGNLQEGVYQVDFRGLDGRNAVRREFRVENASRVAAELEKKKILFESIARLANRQHERIHAMPAGPVRDDTVQRTQELRQNCEKATAATTRAIAAARQLAELQTAPREISQPAMEALSDLSSWANEPFAEDAEMKAFEERTRDMPGACDSLETAAEGLRFVGSMTALLLKPMDVLKDLFKNQLKDEVVTRVLAARGSQPSNSGGGPDPDIKFVLERAKAEVEACYSGGTDAMIRTLPTQSREVSTYIIDKLFSSYCSVIEGPATAEFSVYAPENGKLFYKYNVKLEAKLRLWTQKDQPATPQGIPFTGRLEGSATKMDFAADVFAVEKLPKGAQLVAVKTLPAPTLKKSNTNVIGSGQAFRTLSPGHFNAQYSGLLTEAGMKIKQDRVVDDFGPLFVNRVAVIAILPGGLLPGVSTFSFPVQKGCWIFDRGTKGAFEIPMARTGETILLKKEFTRNEVVGSGIKVDWKLAYDLKGKR